MLQQIPEIADIWTQDATASVFVLRFIPLFRALRAPEVGAKKRPQDSWGSSGNPLSAVGVTEGEENKSGAEACPCAHRLELIVLAEDIRASQIGAIVLGAARC